MSEREAVRVEYTHFEQVDNVRRASEKPYAVDVLYQLMEEGKRRIEDEIAAKGLTPTGAMVVRVTVERWCE